MNTPIHAPTLSARRRNDLFTGLAVAALSIAFLPALSAAPLTSWTQSSGSISSGLNTSSPRLGNGTPESADDQTIWAASSAFTLNAIGDSITLSSGVIFTGLSTPQADQFRFGVYNSNGSSNANGWLGYFATNSGNSGGVTYSRLWERNAENTNNFGSGAGATQISQVNASPSNTSFASGTYNLSLSYTRVATGIQVDWNLIGTNVSYTLTGSFVDTTPLTYTFDRVGLFFGGGLNASQVDFSNVSLDYAPIPEPGVVGMLLGSSLLLMIRRRRRA